MRTRTLGILLSLFGLPLAACVEDNTVIGGGPSGGSGGDGGSGGTGSGGGFEPDSRLDLLLVVDNSIGMANEQERFTSELAQLLAWLAVPPCLGEDGRVVDSEGACPAGTERAFAPVRDIHLGVITSSLGDLTSGACTGGTGVNADDKGRLIDRKKFGTVPTYEDRGFLAYDPDGAMTPPGEASLETFVTRAQDLVLGAGSLGCGYEMPLEAMTRFLADPTPYLELETNGSLLDPVGVDEVVLDQRAAFLRDRSNVAVLVLSDENDCSVAVEDQGFLALKGPFFRATSICLTAPDSPCCTSCGLPTPEGCTPDPTCAEQPKYAANEDHPNLKCYDQKRKYGVDFLYPTQRYVNALSAVQIDPGAPSYVGLDTVANPLFAGGRHPNQVTFLSIAGVPWQDTVVDPSDPESPTMSANELVESGAWDWMTGSAPTDPFMRESVGVRAGTNPATGVSVAASNPINGGDRTISEPNSLQYACTIEIAEPVEFGQFCFDCEGGCDNPVCDGTTQIGDAAFPSRRQLEVARGLADRGAIGSICRDPAALGSAQAMLVRLAAILPKN